MKTEVENPVLVDTFEADSKGRINLGTDFADEEWRIIIEKTDNDN